MQLDRDLRLAALTLARRGLGLRAIARDLKVSRNAVRRILQSGEPEVPALDRGSWLQPHKEVIEGLYATCKGNLVRVKEELQKKLRRSWEEARARGEPVDAEPPRVLYPTLTRFCREERIGHELPKRCGEYDFAPGEEMQHDTSPHRVEVDGKVLLLQCASVVFCYSRVMFVRCYPRWTRFWVRAFLTEAFQFLGALARQCVVDNHSVVVVGSSGENALFAPEAEAFAERFGFHWMAHELGDANRSARVERPFDYIEGNFYPGRSFPTLDGPGGLNEQLKTWCLERNHEWKDKLQAVPCDLFQAEWPHLVKLPCWVPEPYELIVATGDSYGYVRAHTNRYSIPESHIGIECTVRAYPERVEILDGKQLLCTHPRLPDLDGKKHTLPEHRHPRRRARGSPPPPLPHEGELRAQGPAFAAFIDGLRRRHGGRATPAMRRLYRIYQDHPCEDLTLVLAQALDRGLFDLERIERAVLLTVRERRFGPLPRTTPDPEGPPDE